MPKPSITAQRMALHRAVHLIQDQPPFILRDDFALKLSGVTEDSWFGVDKPVHRTPDRIQTRAISVYRARFVEDLVLDAAASGPLQYVILGAGLDSFSLRTPDSANEIEIFEVDHPRMQLWKRQRLDELGLSAPSHTTFVGVDFERHRLSEELPAAGFDNRIPAIFSWLGVTYYLTRPAIEATLRDMLELTDSWVQLVFDYVVPPETLPTDDREWFTLYHQRVADLGEPWHGIFTPTEVATMLTDSGFDDLEDLSAAEINATHFSGRSDELNWPAAVRLMHASRGL